MASKQAPPPAPSNVIQFDKAVQRKRVIAAVKAALERWQPIATVEATEQLAAFDITIDQVIHSLPRAKIMEFSEDSTNGRLLFTARMLSAGEEFFVLVAVERVVPFPDCHVVIKGVWR